MARGVNKVILIGNLGDEPTVRQTTSGRSVASISMVTNEVRRNSETGEYTEFAEWHRVTMWNKLAEIAGQYLHKGSQVYIEGKLRTRSYDKDGQKHYVTEVVADEMQMLGSRQGGASAGATATATAGYGQQSATNSAYQAAGSNPWAQKSAPAYGAQAPQAASPYGAQGAGAYGQQAPAANPYGANTAAPQGVYGAQSSPAPMQNAYGAAPAAPMQSPYQAPAAQSQPMQPGFSQPTAEPQPNAYTAQSAEPTEPAMTMNDDIPF